MREVAAVCPRCGRRRYLGVDAWSGVPDAELRRPCPGGCGGATAGLKYGAVLLAVAVIVVPIIGVLEALSR